MVRVFKTKPFARFASRENIRDEALLEAVAGAVRGLIDADLGGSVIKQRIARSGQGKSKGYRSIVLLRHKDRAIFAYGFAKSDRTNIRDDELAAFRLLAQELLGMDEAKLEQALAKGALLEVTGYE